MNIKIIGSFITGIVLGGVGAYMYFKKNKEREIEFIYTNDPDVLTKEEVIDDSEECEKEDIEFYEQSKNDIDATIYHQDAFKAAEHEKTFNDIKES
ncbi:MAG: hypothetical protein L0Y61_06145, partial [Epsilonproteobacteria bacterium]|nr:hypothetical protein [Campylobacterota bacterium]